MASVNNMFLIAGEPVKRYVKTLPSKISGSRLEPGSDAVHPIYFVLESLRDAPFSYEAEVLELYTDKEVKYFMQANKSLVAAGFIKEYNGTISEPDVTNFLSDEDVQIIAAIKTVPALTNRLDELTSRVAVHRVLDAANDIGRPKRFIDAIELRLMEFSSE